MPAKGGVLHPHILHRLFISFIIILLTKKKNCASTKPIGRRRKKDLEILGKVWSKVWGSESLIFTELTEM